MFTPERAGEPMSILMRGGEEDEGWRLEGKKWSTEQVEG